MAKNTQMSDLSVNTQADAWSALLNNGYLRIYDGTQPADASVAVSTQVLLSTLRFNATAAPAAVSGLVTFNAMTSDTDAAASGTPTWFRAFKSDGTTVVYDGSVGTSNANLILGAATIAQHQTVSVTSLTHDVRNATSGL